RQKAAGM
ncbi:hypothetical protein ECFRIK1999_5859, partial [Escherichia coli FRIK1999]